MQTAPGENSIALIRRLLAGNAPPPVVDTRPAPKASDAVSVSGVRLTPEDVMNTNLSQALSLIHISEPTRPRLI
eukprot:2883983-Rhodomonas_salina.1